MKKIQYVIKGGKPVKGEIACLGAKNFAIKAMITALLADTPTTLYNVPDIGDVKITEGLLASIGVKITYPQNAVMTIDPSGLKSAHIPTPDSGSNRIPILLLSILLQRFNEVSVPVVGGCKIGERKVNFHIEAIRNFGAEVEENKDGYIAHRSKPLRGTHIDLPFPSVGATETCLFLGVRAQGKTVITNAAIEPEIFELITMLRAMGAHIFTSSGRKICIEGVENLEGTYMPVLGDRIEAASWACLACASDGDITVHGIQPSNLGNFLSYYQQIGGGYRLRGPESIQFFRKSALRPAILETDVFPGFSTDWQQPFSVVLTQADGISIIHETVYEKRFGYLSALNKLGAKTQLTSKCLGGIQCRYRDTQHEHSAIIIGPTPFEAAESIEIPDLRAGLAYVIAAAIARGTTTLNGVHFLERGYGNIVPRLNAINLEIERVEIDE